MNKLLPIAETIKQLLELEFGEEANYTLECKKDWLKNVPDKDLYKEFWSEINNVYESLIDDRWELDSVLSHDLRKSRSRNAQVDIWFHRPFNFICEFDEKQHFNQHRLITLGAKLYTKGVSFDLDHYYELSKNSVAKPGKYGFDKLKSKDVLFPEMLEGEKQDNRTRQRAFRDFLKDIVPVKLGYNPTVRISYKTTNNKIKDFTDVDLESVKRYLYDNRIFNKMKIQY